MTLCAIWYLLVTSCDLSITCDLPVTREPPVTSDDTLSHPEIVTYSWVTSRDLQVTSDGTQCALMTCR